MKINDFHEIRGFRDGAQLRHSCRVVKSAENVFFQEKTFFFLRNKNMSRIVSDVAAGVGAPWEHSKSSKILIFPEIRFFEQIWPSFRRNEYIFQSKIVSLW